MSDNIIRTSSGADGDATDWDRIRALTDEQIEQAIASDPDTYAVKDAELLGARGTSFRYQLHRDGEGHWRWALCSAAGEVLAISGRSYASRQRVIEAIGKLREAMGGARSEAA
jgi:uncharacterized protein YegP (UPF0339 family)